MNKKIYYFVTLLSISIVFMFGICDNLLYSQDINIESIERIRTHINTLCSDEFDGRLAGTEGNIKASNYVQDYIKKLNLLPVNDKYNQDFPITTGVSFGNKCAVSFTKLIEKEGVPQEMWRKSEKKWNLSTEWQPLSISDNGSITGEIAFAGYGISTSENNYDDYAGIDVKGKIVIILTDSALDSPKNNFFGKYADLKLKAKNAKDHGAVGIIFIKALSDSANTFYPQKPEDMVNLPGIIAIQATRTDIAQFFPRSLMLYPTELEINSKKKPKSFVLPNVTVSITVDIAPEIKTISNVIGMIKGQNSQKANEYIIIACNFDYLGRETKIQKYRKLPQQILKGADDNASGVAVALELANRLAVKPIGKSIIFVFFNAKERNNIGSDFFINNPIIPLNNVAFALNLNILGRLKTGKLSSFNFQKLADIQSNASTLAQTESLTIQNYDDFNIPGDDKVLSTKIPVITLSTGINDDYRKYTDLPDKINFDGMLKITNFVESLLRTVGN